MFRTVRHQVYRMRTEGAGRARRAAAIGLGVLVGSSPFYGFHLPLCWLLGKLLGLNRLTAYLAAQISNPLLAPVLVLLEVQVGAWVSRGTTHALAMETIKRGDLAVFGSDLAVGWLVVGGLLAAVASTATYAVGESTDPFFSTLVERAADRYLAQSLVAWEFARGKLYRDPIYQTVLRREVLASGQTLVDVGCGQGLMLTLLVEAAAVDAAAWPGDWRMPPRFDRLIGIETRARVAHLARAALGDTAVITEADAHAAFLEPCSAVLIIDVLHMMPADAQARLIHRLTASLNPGGTMLIREADASAGWRFAIVRSVNWLQAARQGGWRKPFHYRTTEGWVALFTECGLDAQVMEQLGGNTLGNVLLRVRHR